MGKEKAMKKQSAIRFLVIVCINGLLLSLVSGCGKKDKDKIPITTSSEQAGDYFLEGRDLFERLQIQESRQFFEQAVTEDPDFAMGHLFLSFSLPTARGFFEELEKAVSLTEEVSEGEWLWIQGVEAGAYGRPIKQRELYQKLVELYPKDERAHTLLANNYFGQQEWDQAIAEYERALEINPDFSQPYNQLGYANRFLGRYEQAEEAFQKYIELIPNDPNPYDSYAELLLKMGRYEESIKAYRKALEYNPNFVNSHVGIATNLNLQDKHPQAVEQLHHLLDIARNDGERRAAHFALAVSYVDGGQMDRALQELETQYALAENNNDFTAMAGDLVAMGNIYLEMERPDEAESTFKKAVQLVESSDRSDEIKDNWRRGYLYNIARVALIKGNIDEVRTATAEYTRQVEAINNPLQIKLAHELAGMIALAEEDFDTALVELEQTNLQDPYNLYRLGLAYQGKGDREAARDHFLRAADFNALNNMNYAFIRHQTRTLAETMEMLRSSAKTIGKDNRNRD
jgi:tetratricopeptide (TPR) repeat protein